MHSIQYVPVRIVRRRSATEVEIVVGRPEVPIDSSATAELPLLSIVFSGLCLWTTNQLSGLVEAHHVTNLNVATGAPSALRPRVNLQLLFPNKYFTVNLFIDLN